MTLLGTPLRIGSATVRNRLYRAPVLEGAGSGPDAGQIYAKAFTANARHGVGLIVQGNSCIYDEGRTSPGMTLVNTRERVLRLGEMVEAVHAEGASIFLQIGHGGLYAMEAWHHPYAAERREPLLAPSPGARKRCDACERPRRCELFRLAWVGGERRHAQRDWRDGDRQGGEGAEC